MDLVDDEDISCNDFESMLLNPDEMKLYLKKLKDNCSSFDAKIERTIFQSISKNFESAKQVERSYQTLTNLTSQKKELKNAIDNLKLDQKVIEKKAINGMKDMEKIRTDIEALKEKKETLMLELVDLKEESQKSNEHMKKQWNAVKKACKIYKNILDLHIDSQMIDHVEHVTVTFFWSENPTDHKYFVVLTYENDCWKVKKIEPELSMECKYQLSRAVHFSKQSEVINVTLLLCELRKLFLKNYFINVN